MLYIIDEMTIYCIKVSSAQNCHFCNTNIICVIIYKFCVIINIYVSVQLSHGTLNDNWNILHPIILKKKEKNNRCDNS